jgi:hypothetical protein
VYLYHVLFININICDTDCQKKKLMRNLVFLSFDMRLKTQRFFYKEHILILRGYQLHLAVLCMHTTKIKKTNTVKEKSRNIDLFLKGVLTPSRQR